MNIKKILVGFGAFLGSIYTTYAHCPLCTAGAAVALVGAGYLGVNKAVLALFLGAFAVSTGLWFSNLIKKKFIIFQKQIIVFFSFIFTIFPLMPMFNYVYPVYIDLYGEIGSLLNTTYIINMYYVFTIIGGLVVIYSPKVSDYITKLREGKRFAFQGIVMSFLNLILLGIILQIIL